MTRFTNRLGVCSFAAALFLLTPKSFSVVTLTLGVALVAALYYFQKMWVEGEPNQWVLVIRDGKMVRSGIGLKTVVWPFESFVKFPSRVSMVEFKAMNVTKENQGVEISGFAFWSVFREGDGPFKCYKYMQGGDPNANVRTMCESVIRSQLANSSLMDVLRNRTLIRDKMKKDLEGQLSGWGVWLETIELTDVRICSKRLFQDLQADYRQEVHAKSQKISLLTNEQLKQKQISSDQKLTEARENKYTQNIIITTNEQIKRTEADAQFTEKTYALERRKIEKNQQIRLQRLNNALEVQQKQQEYEHELERNKKAHELQMFTKELETTNTHNELSMRNYIMEGAARAFGYQSKNIQLNQYSGDENGMAKLLPTLQAVTALRSDK